MAQRKDRGDHTFLPARGDRLYVQVSFKEFGGDYEQAIRGQKDDAQVYSLANKAIVREGLELWVEGMDSSNIIGAEAWTGINDPGIKEAIEAKKQGLN